MRVLTLILLVGPAMAGCASGPIDTDCRHGPDPLFIRSFVTDGREPSEAGAFFDYASIDRDGVVTTLQGRAAGGTGRLVAGPGALDGLSLDDVVVELRRLSAYDVGRDVTIEMAARETMTKEAFRSLCATVAGSFYDLPADADTAPCDATPPRTIIVSSPLGVHAVSSACAEPPEAFATVRDALSVAA